MNHMCVHCDPVGNTHTHTCSHMQALLESFHTHRAWRLKTHTHAPLSHTPHCRTRPNHRTPPSKLHAIHDHTVSFSSPLLYLPAPLRSAGVSARLYREFLEPILLVTLFAPGHKLSAAAALDALYYFALAHQVRRPEQGARAGAGAVG